ncbi:MAG: TRAP transporter small permease [Thermodesulfobacteriota bacterium]
MHRWFNTFENILTYMAALSALFMMCLTTVDAVGRYVFNRPIHGAYEITENYLAVLTVFLGICYAYREGTFIRVSFFIDRMPSRVKTGMLYFGQAFSVLLCIAFLIATTYQACSKFGSGITLSFLPIPIWPAYVVVSLGFFPLALLMVFDLWRVKARESDGVKEESPVV